MAFINPNDPSEILYGASGDVRNEVNAYAASTTPGHYVDETEIPGSLIISALEEATREIDMYLEPVYADQIPFSATSAVPKYLDKVAKNMAMYFVWRAAFAILGNLPDEKKAQYYDTYTDPKTGILTRIKDGELKLRELQTATPDETHSVRETGRNPVFDIDDDLNQTVDPRLIDDIDRDRNA